MFGLYWFYCACLSSSSIKMLVSYYLFNLSCKELDLNNFASYFNCMISTAKFYYWDTCSEKFVFFPSFSPILFSFKFFSSLTLVSKEGYLTSLSASLFGFSTAKQVCPISEADFIYAYPFKEPLFLLFACFKKVFPLFSIFFPSKLMDSVWS